MLSNKRGLNRIIAIVLLIVVGAASLTILWQSIKPSVSDPGGSLLGTECLVLDIGPLTCEYAVSEGTATLKIKRNQDSANINLEGVKIIFYLSNGETIHRELETLPGELETQINPTPISILPEISGKTINEVKVAGIIRINNNLQICRLSEGIRCRNV